MIHRFRKQIEDVIQHVQGAQPGAISTDDYHELIVWVKAIKESLYSLVLQINPHARLSLLLMLAHVDQIKAALHSDGKSRPLRAQWM